MQRQLRRHRELWDLQHLRQMKTSTSNTFSVPSLSGTTGGDEYMLCLLLLCIRR